MHIVIVNRWPRFPIPTRWDNELTRYEEFVDHRTNQVSYVVDGPGAAGVLADPAQIAHQVQVHDVNDFVALRDAVAEVIERVGPVDQLIAFSEFTLEIAARVREDLGIPGPTTVDVAVYRDKVRMKEILSLAGIRIPRFAGCEEVEQCLSFAKEHGYPVILKPVAGAASIGVHRVDTAETLIQLLGVVPMSGYEIEEFIVGDIYHVDGFVGADESVQFQVVSRYLNDCLGFEQGAPLGSFVVQESPLRTRIEDFTANCLSALGMRELPFHLELFHTPADELVFLEVGGRVGGSEVPHLLNKLFGVNLFEVWLRALTGTPIPIPMKTADPAGGWLVIPKPKRLPAKVVQATSMSDRVATIWRELIPQAGEVLEPGGSYDALHSGRFILLGGSQQQVEADLHRIIAEFRLEATEL